MYVRAMMIALAALICGIPASAHMTTKCANAIMDHATGHEEARKQGVAVLMAWQKECEARMGGDDEAANTCAYMKSDHPL